MTSHILYPLYAAPLVPCTCIRVVLNERAPTGFTCSVHLNSNFVDVFIIVQILSLLFISLSPFSISSIPAAPLDLSFFAKAPPREPVSGAENILGGNHDKLEHPDIRREGWDEEDVE